MATLASYWQALAQSLDDLSVLTASTATSSTVVVPLLVNATANASTDRFNGGKFLFVISGTGSGQQRTVRTSGYAPSTGTLTVDPTWTAPSSATLGMTSLFPVVSEPMGGKTDYLAIVNRALGLLAMPDRLSLSVSSATVSLSSYPWLDRAERITGYLEGPVIVGRPPRPCEWRGPRWVMSGTSTSIELQAPFTGTLYLDVLRPANTLINGSESTSGLSAQTDTAPAAVEDVVKLGRLVAFQVLAARSPGVPNGNYAQRYAEAYAEAQTVRYLDRTQFAQMPQPTAAARQEAA